MSTGTLFATWLLANVIFWARTVAVFMRSCRARDKALHQLADRDQPPAGTGFDFNHGKVQ